MIAYQARYDTRTWLDASGRWRIQLYTSGGELTTLQPEWDRLLAASDADRFFSLHAWQQLWWQHFGHAYTLRLLAIWDRSGRLVALAPLMASRFDLTATISLIGGSEIADFLDLIVDRRDADELRTVLLTTIREHLEWRCLDLHGLPEQSRTRGALAEQYPKHGISVAVEQGDVSPSVRLAGSWGGYLAALPKKDRHELRRKLRRAVDDQGAEWRTVRSAADLGSNLDTFILLHRLSSSEKAAFMTAQMAMYFRDLSALALAHGWLRLRVLWAGDAPVAAALGFAYKDRLYLYNSGYAPAYAAQCVGIAAVGLMLRDSAQEGLAVFDFLQGNEPYKYTLGAEDHAVYRVVGRRGRGT